MSNRVIIRPSWSGALAFWLGSDHYSLREALCRKPFVIPVDRVVRVHEIKARPLIGLGSPTRYAIEYQSDIRDCFITLESLPEELRDKDRSTTNPPGAALLFLSHSRREPSALLLPFLVPAFFVLMTLLLGLWNDQVLHDKDVLSFFANSACDVNCVRKVLSIHSLVFFLFLFQFSLLLLPLALFWFQAPRYRSALNYRLIQTYSVTTIMVGTVIFLQLVAFFPFRQYGRFVEMGFGPKVERLISNLNKTKN